MKRDVSFYGLCLVLLGVLSAVGCSSPVSWWSPGRGRPGIDGSAAAHELITPSDAASSMLRRQAGQDASGGDDVRVVGLVFDVARVDFPVDSSSGRRHSRKIWNHVDALRAASERVARLARNGLRVGAASPDAWPAIRAILQAADAEVRRDQFVAQPGLPLAIQLGPVSGVESIFSYGPEGRLVGRTFPVGDKLLVLDYVFHHELGGCTELRLNLEVRHDRGAMAFEKVEGVIRQVPDYDRHVFTEVEAALTLNTDEFLVIGLSDRAEHEYLLGSRFLTFERSGTAYETLLCITPRPYQTSGGRHPPT